MKILIILTLFISTSVACAAQTMSSIFCLLPKDCIPDLTIQQKRFLLKNKNYILPGGDSLETIRYTIDVEEQKQYLSCEMNFTTGQNGFNFYQLKKFVKKDGGTLIVFSRYGGLLRSYFQEGIRCFNYAGNKLIEIRSKILPDSIEIKKFFKPGTPDSIIVKLGSYISTSCNLNPGLKNTIVFTIFFEVVDKADEKYIIGDTMPFIWTGQKFKQGPILYYD